MKPNEELSIDLRMQRIHEALKFREPNEFTQGQGESDPVAAESIGAWNNWTDFSQFSQFDNQV